MPVSSFLTGAYSALAFFAGGDLAAVACTLVGVMRFSSCLTGAKSALAFFSGGDFTAVSFPLVGVGVLGLGSAFTVDDGCAVKVDNASLLAFSLGSFSDWEVVVGKTSGALLAVSPPLAALDGQLTHVLYGLRTFFFTILRRILGKEQEPGKGEDRNQESAPKSGPYR